MENDSKPPNCIGDATPDDGKSKTSKPPTRDKTSSLWNRWTACAAEWLARAERRIMENFRVPPGG
ncbi:hypothetical protein [Diaphorobacter caeni]|uniref:hypothetical protein n=1 Tax=Diaphorobacter caeni TaxID=2784387 RepID=UPI001890AC73|nr:hypothetical protein [Diaphorobacter caeni]MBF5006646.1 hypothetical protein [Diaphorobacter caeni]